MVWVINPVAIKYRGPARLRGGRPSIIASDAAISDSISRLGTDLAPAYATAQANVAAAIAAGVQAAGTGEQLPIRTNAENAGGMALMYRLTGTDSYRTAAEAFALDVCGQATWGAGSVDGVDLAAGGALWGMAMVFDWLWDACTASTHELIARTLVTRGRQMYASLAAEIWPYSSGHPYPLFMQNHEHLRLTGLLGAATALRNIIPTEATTWATLVGDRWQYCFESIWGSDGSWHEGQGYFGAMLEAVARCTEVLRAHWSVDLSGYDWLSAAPDFLLHFLLPEDSWVQSTQNVATFGQSARYHWYGPSYLAHWLAAEFQRADMQWLGDRCLTLGKGQLWMPWHSLLWRDADLSAAEPTATTALFSEGGMAAARSSWDGDASLLAVRCSEPWDSHAMAASAGRSLGGNHWFPDAGTFVLFAAGHYLVADPGYVASLTSQENVLQAGAYGQRGEWPGHLVSSAYMGYLGLSQHPHIDGLTTADGVTHIACDPTDAYGYSGDPVTHWHRHFLYVPEAEALVVLDDVTASSAADLRLRFHTDCDSGSLASDVYSGSDYRFENLLPAGLTVTATDDNITSYPAGTTTATWFSYTALKAAATDWRTATAITWGASPATVGLSQAGDVWTFTCGGYTVSFDWSTETVV